MLTDRNSDNRNRKKVSPSAITNNPPSTLANPCSINTPRMGFQLT
jgi:hypothetical protein